MSFSVSAGLAGGLVGGLGAYETILKEDRSEAANQRKLQAQQEREENMARLKQTMGREDYTFKAEEDARLKNSPEAILARDAEYERETQAGISRAQKMKDAERSDMMSPEAKAQRDAKAAEENQRATTAFQSKLTAATQVKDADGNPLTPEAKSKVVAKLLGITVAAENKRLTADQRQKNSMAIEKEVNKAFPMTGLDAQEILEIKPSRTALRAELEAQTAAELGEQTTSLFAKPEGEEASGNKTLDPAGMETAAVNIVRGNGTFEEAKKMLSPVAYRKLEALVMEKEAEGLARTSNTSSQLGRVEKDYSSYPEGPAAYTSTGDGKKYSLLDPLKKHLKKQSRLRAGQVDQLNY